MYERTDSTTLIAYKLRWRRPSIATLEDSEKRPSEFVPIEEIAATKTSSVRLFSNAAGERIVIKSPQIPVERGLLEAGDDFEKLIADKEHYVRKEFELMKQAYPHELPYALAIVADSETHDYRIIMPYINGLTFSEYASTPHRNSTWLVFFMAIARELKRIHLRGVIHGDIKEDNGLVKPHEECDGFDIHFIDFDRAYFMSDEMAEVTYDTGAAALHWSPERRVARDAPHPAPDVKQDVFSYGSMLLRLIHKTDGFEGAYPTFFSSITATQHDDPTMRPELEQLITQAASCLGS